MKGEADPGPGLPGLKASSNAAMINNVSNMNGTTRDTIAKSQPHFNTVIYRPNLNYEIERVSNEGEKQLPLVRLLRENEGSGIIYAATVREVKCIADYLKQIGIDVTPYHGQLGEDERQRNRDRFLSGDYKAIVAIGAYGSEPLEDAFELDIDKPDIRFVIHYNTPTSLDAYFQESSLAGRDGHPARCALLFQIADRRTQLFFMNGRSPKPEEVIAIYETLKRIDANLAPATLELIQTSVNNVARIKVRATLSLLKNMGFIKEHRGARYTLLNRELDAQEMKKLAAEYTSKGDSDRGKLERMTLYAQSPECRWKLLLDYFDDDSGLKKCGHCDNCDRPSTEKSHTSENATKSDFIDLLFAYHRKDETRIMPGDVVKLPSHGEVKVKAVEGDKIVVSLPGGEIRKFKQEWVIR